MATIEERAHAYATKIVGGWYSGGFKGDMWDAAYERYIEIATEQDIIARQEEREKCLNEVCEWIDYNMDAAPCEVDHFIKELRQAMEGGEG